MTDRLETIFSYLTPCKVFADIGCDHGYMARAMVESGKCKKFIISDVSAKCLQKAKTLLKEYIDNGVGNAVVSNGFDKVGECDLALIAGMGGEEIVGILLRAKLLPERLVLQPMKNCDKVRVACLSLGYKFITDVVFFAEEKFYDLMVLERGKESLTAEQIEFGKTNLELRPKTFTDRLKIRLDKLKKYLEDEAMSQEGRRKILSEIERISKYV